MSQKLNLTRVSVRRARKYAGVQFSFSDDVQEAIESQESVAERLEDVADELTALLSDLWRFFPSGVVEGSTAH